MKEKKRNVITLTTTKGIDVFTSRKLSELMLKSLRHYQNSYGLIIHGYVILPSKIMFVASQEEDQLISVVNSLKKYSTAKVVEALQKSRDIRKSWMLATFAAEGDFSSEIPFKLWKDQDKILVINEGEETSNYLESIYMEPVKLGIVSQPEAYCHSSASDINFDDLLPDIEHIERVIVPF